MTEEQTKGPTGMCSCDPKFGWDRHACKMGKLTRNPESFCTCRCHTPPWRTEPVADTIDEKPKKCPHGRWRIEELRERCPVCDGPSVERFNVTCGECRGQGTTEHEGLHGPLTCERCGGSGVIGFPPQVAPDVSDTRFANVPKMSPREVIEYIADINHRDGGPPFLIAQRWLSQNPEEADSAGAERNWKSWAIVLSEALAPAIESMEILLAHVGDAPVERENYLFAKETLEEYQAAQF